MSFAGAPDYVAESWPEFSEEHLGSPGFDPGLSRIVEQGENIVGFLLARRRTHEPVGYVDILAVHPDHQRRGLGTALLTTAFAAFAAAGLREAQLSVASDNPRALRVYERAGMRPRLQFDIYERPVASTPSLVPSLPDPVASPPSRWRSYRDVDAAGDPGSLAGQLDDIASVPFVAAEKRRSLALLELAPGGTVLDVGCGTGLELEHLADIVGQRGHVVGLERSTALIADARSRGRERRPIDLVHGDAGALPFGAGEFDACRADRTLQHLDRPEVALREMIRVTRAGGRVVVTESRWGLVAPSLDQDLTDRVLWLMATGAEQAGWVGHRLAAMFGQAGLIDVRSVSSDYTACERDELFRFTHLRSSVAEAVRAGALAEEQATAWLASLDDLVARGEAFAMVLILHVAGTKPVG